MSHTKNFFEQKKEWSQVKDDLLSYYLEPYFTKILNLGPLLYIDGFAGTGKFDDGKEGSPLIALNKLNYVLELKKKKNTDKYYDVKLCFIEADHKKFLELEKNIHLHKLANKTDLRNENFKEHILTIIDMYAELSSQVRHFI